MEAGAIFQISNLTWSRNIIIEKLILLQLDGNNQAELNRFYSINVLSVESTVTLSRGAAQRLPRHSISVDSIRCPACKRLAGYSQHGTVNPG